MIIKYNSIQICVAFTSDSGCQAEQAIMPSDDAISVEMFVL